MVTGGSKDAFRVPAGLLGDIGDTPFLAKVTDDSLSPAGVSEGDWAVVRSQKTAEDGQVIAVMIDGDLLVRIWDLKSGPGSVWLMPCHRDYVPVPFPVRRATVLGVVVAVIRRIEGNRT